MNTNYKKLAIIFGIIILIFIIIFVVNKFISTGKSIGNYREALDKLTKEKETCPFECCLNEENYLIKQCNQDYECINNKCIAIDSDNDGLSDIEERNIGTNPQSYDSDGDTLSDYKEYQDGTNPLNKNTDRDRYDDNEDLEPLITNSAYISIVPVNRAWNWDVVNIGILIATFGGIISLNPDMIIAEPIINLKISNTGNDYSQYVIYDLVFRVSNTEIRRKEISLNKINANEEIVKNYQETITLRDIPDIVINLVKQQTTDWTIDVENLNYEKYN